MWEVALFIIALDISTLTFLFLCQNVIPILHTTTTTRLSSAISVLMRVRCFTHDVTSPLLSVPRHVWLQPHVLHIANQPRSQSHPWPAPTSAAYHFHFPASAHPIILCLALDMPKPPQSPTSHNLHDTLNSKSFP